MPIKPSINFLNFWRVPDAELVPLFQAQPLPQYADFLQRHPRIAVDAQEIVYLPRGLYDDRIKAMHHMYRGMYVKNDKNDYWDDELPGDCENQCLRLLRHFNACGYPTHCFRLVIAKTEKKEGHCLLALFTYNKKMKQITQLIDFRLTEPLLSPKHKAFAQYQFLQMAPYGRNEWTGVTVV